MVIRTRLLNGLSVADGSIAELAEAVSGDQRCTSGMIGVVLALLPTGPPMGFVAKNSAT
jgi:hypothetical protein